MSKIKLSELKASRAAMTPGQFNYSYSEGKIEAPGVNEFLPKSICEMFIGNCGANARGIVATHNAADALIEVVGALLARRAAVRARVEAERAKWTDGWQDQEARYQAILAEEQACGERLERALAEIDP